MPTITVSDDIEFFYRDSGSVPKVAYTTIVTVHGLGFNGAVFERLEPLAPKHGFRIVSLYRRDYAPSSPLTKSELGQMSGGVEEQRKFISRQGMLVAEFLDRFIQENETTLTPSKPDGSGGLVLLGWSQGSSTVNAMLSVVDVMPKDMINRFEKYLHIVLYYDPPPSCVGLPGPSEFKPTFFAFEKVEDRFRGFGEWVAAYYDHKDIYSLDTNLLEHYTPSARKPASFFGTPEIDLSKYTSLDAFGGSDVAWIFLNPALSKEAAVRSWFDAGLAKILPGLKVRVLACGNTPAAVMWSVWEIKKAVENPGSWDGEKGRDIKVTIAAEGNHFLFWDEPEKSLRLFKSCIES